MMRPIPFMFAAAGLLLLAAAVVSFPQGEAIIKGKVVLVDGFAQSGAGVRHKRVSTGSITLGVNVPITLTWDAAFADTNYTVGCSIEDGATGLASLEVHHLESKTASGVVVRVNNLDLTTARTGTLHCWAFHD